MEFSKYLMNQIGQHPAMQPQDIVKMCYQAAFGAEHLLEDIEAARRFFYEEYNHICASDDNLYEEISTNVCRVNLAPWKGSGVPEEWLFRMFVSSAKKTAGSEDLFFQYLKDAEGIVQNKKLSFGEDEWKVFVTKYKENGIRAVHHSEVYRDREKPAYRIIDSSFLRVFPILQKASVVSSSQKKINVIVIDGNAASGKSTMAEMLKEILGAEIIHMDDFFLPLELRTEARLQEPGGNVHYERFLEEVIPHIGAEEEFSYRNFDCSKMNYNGQSVIKNVPWRIVEGAYSCHPIFGNYADLKVFLSIDREEQMQRILRRNGEEMAEMFRKLWIPLEEKYFEEYKIRDDADIII